MDLLTRRSAVAGLILFSLFAAAIALHALAPSPDSTTLVLPSPHLKAMPGVTRALSVDGLFLETAQGRTALPPELTKPGPAGAASWTHRATLADGRVVSLSVARQGDRMTLSLAARPDAGVVRWGLSIDAARDEYFTGLTERVVDGPQQASWAPGITEAMNLRGQQIEFLVKPTLSIYAPFYLSSRGYSVTVRGTWPGHFDFAAARPDRVAIDFEGPSLTLVITTASTPAELVRAHALEAGPTRNVGFWNLPREPRYDDVLIATWRLYARLHERLADYSYTQAVAAARTGMPIVRPLFLVDPDAPQAWSNWWTYLYGPDLVVSPVWEKGKRSQEVYLPAGSKWRSAWGPGVYPGGQTVVATAEPHQIPIFVRVGSNLDLGDLSREWTDAQRIARGRPDLAAFEAGVSAWFAEHTGKR